MLQHGVYRISNLKNNKCYIGSAAKYSFKTRWAKHRRDLKRNDHHSIKLQRAWNKYSAGSFVFEVLLYCDPKDCLMYEQIALDHFKPEYNINPIAGNCLGLKWTKKQRNEFSASKKGQKFSKQHKQALSENHADVSGKKNPFWGREHKTTTKKRIVERCKEIALRGSKNPTSKLNEDEVRFIRRSLKDGSKTGAELADMFGVTRTTISRIKNNPKVWPHVN